MGYSRETPRTVIMLIFILMLGAALRLYALGIVPQGVTHDEMGYIYNAYSIAKTGRNVFGEPLPLFTWMTRGGFPFMPVPVYSMAALFSVVPLIPFTARLIPALLGIADILLLYAAVRMMFGSVTLSLASSLFLAISPWHLHFSRSAYDANFSLFLFLAAIAVFLAERAKKRIPWLFSVPLILGMYGYRGMGMLAFPIAVLLMWYAKKKRSVTRRHMFAFGVILAVSAAAYLAPVFRYGSAYTAEGMLLFTDPKMQMRIDAAIREAKGPLLVKRIFANKPTYIIDRFRENYLKAYSPEFLFLYTEPSAIYTIWSRGRIYFLDLFFLLPGALFLWKKDRRSASIWFGLLLIGGIPGGIGGLPYSSRNYLLSAVFPVFAAAGVMYAVAVPSSKRLRTAAVVAVTVAYVYAFGSYLYDYYGRYAWQGAEGWAKSIKEISLLAAEKRTAYDLVVLGRTSFGDTVEYAFWNGLRPEPVQESWKNRVSQPFTYFETQGVVFSEKCLDPGDFRHSLFSGIRNVYYVTAHTCNNDATPASYIRDYFGNPLWKTFEIDTAKPETFRGL